jgi:hypothetical protein
MRVTLMLPASATRPDAVNAALLDPTWPLLIPIEMLAPLAQAARDDAILTSHSPSNVPAAAGVAADNPASRMAAMVALRTCSMAFPLVEAAMVTRHAAAECDGSHAGGAPIELHADRFRGRSFGRAGSSLYETEPDIPELKARIAAALDFLAGLPPAAINDAGNKQVVFRFRSGSEQTFTGQSLLLTFSAPQFLFHVATAYDILRHCGVSILKKDFLGTPPGRSRED